MFINNLVDEINQLNCGIQIKANFMLSVLYADDIAFIAGDEDSLQSVRLCQAVVYKIALADASKTKIVHYRPVSTARTGFKFSRGNDDIDARNAKKILVCGHGFYVSHRPGRCFNRDTNDFIYYVNICVTQ